MRVPAPISLACLILAFFLSSYSRAQERDLPAEREVERKCLECHNNPALHGARADGKLHSMYVETGKYRESIHSEKEYTCLTCHPDATPDYHPREGVTIRSCGDCHDHEDELADFRKSRHGRALEEGAKDAADCTSCHSNHYTRKKDDPEARVHPDRIRETCGACHEGEARLTASGTWWAGSRVSAHGKIDLSEGYNIRNCRNCHFGEDTHRTPPQEERAACAACHLHSVSPGEEGPAWAGPVHIASETQLGEAFSVVRGTGVLLVLLGALAAAVPAVLIFLRFRAGKVPGKEGEGG